MGEPTVLDSIIEGVKADVAAREAAVDYQTIKQASAQAGGGTNTIEAFAPVALTAAATESNTGMPSTAVYFVLPASIAWIAASLMLAGVSKSGSPAPRPMTLRPGTLRS